MCDDTEVKGNGNGDVRSLILNPLKHYVENMVRSDIKGTFFVDMAHFIFLKKHHNTSEDYFCFLEAIEILFKHQMDVQLHLHPQWMVRIADPASKIDARWNLGMLNVEEIDFLVKEGRKCLEEIGRRFYREYEVIAFKAGSWGLTPIEKVLPVLTKHNIKVVIGPCGNISLPELGVDYSAYRSKRGTIQIDDAQLLLMTEVSHGILDLLLLDFDKLKIRRQNIKQSPHSISQSPLTSARLSYYSRFKLVTHLRMNWQSPQYITRLIKRVMENPSVQYAYVETHTKDFSKAQFDAPSYFRKQLDNEYQYLTITDYVSNHC